MTSNTKVLYTGKPARHPAAAMARRKAMTAVLISNSRHLARLALAPIRNSCLQRAGQLALSVRWAWPQAK